MNAYAEMVKIGDSGIGCNSRAQSRIRTTRHIMVTLVGEPEIAHGTHTFPAKADGSHECTMGCRPVWPEWVTDEMFHYAARLACEMLERRGAYNRGERIAA
jgi:hypothetical protein